MSPEAAKIPDLHGGRGGDLQAEIAKYSDMLAQDPKSRAFALLAEAYRKNGQFEEAVKTAQAGLKLYPYYLSGRVALARAYYEGGQSEKAREEFEKVIAAAPDNLMAHRHLAEIYLQEGKHIQAAKSLKMVVLLDPRDDRSRERLMSITATEEKPAARSGGTEMLLESHRYAPPPAAPAPKPPLPPPLEFQPMTDQEMLHRPELVAQTPPAPPLPPDLDLEEVPAPETPRFKEMAAHPVAPGGQPPPLEPAWEAGLEGILPGEEPPDELNTETLAEIYIQQGFYEKALFIFRKILAGRPGDGRLQQRCQELAKLSKASGELAWGEPRPEPPPLRSAALPVTSPAGAVQASPPVKAPAPAAPPPKEAEALNTLRQWLEHIKTEKR